MVEKSDSLEIGENPTKELTILWVMDAIYNKAKTIVERFPDLRQETKDALAAFEPIENNPPGELEDLKVAHQTLVQALENELGPQTSSSIFSLPQELRDFDDFVQKITLTFREHDFEAVTVATAVDIILGKLKINEVSERYRFYIKELVLNIIDECLPEFIDVKAKTEKRLYLLVEEENIEEILNLLTHMDIELIARKNELGETLVKDILEVREQIRSQRVEFILSPKETGEETFETARDEAIDEEPPIAGGLTLDQIDKFLSALNTREEAVIRILEEIKEIRTNLTDVRQNSKFSAENLEFLRKLEERTIEFLLKQNSATTTTAEEPPPNNVTPLFPRGKA